ncbi:fungal zn(2)-Cys(6) binuclear cluster domain-containing protein [Hirsutella rhossiliensis]|uniref:Fungal zn(2)-Cys(6) binuclear cluster domain-containing protein n=1 Tax=Hirsutella rhossiliensis TaxID=111463 RepID=A0A9P8N0Q9_9HYPO|nr:fungal zn(2)-Cys(6) binuclear cluster domain-containing protein [Hirsutella rhossiliensis]KAH0963824.1 fungal zn(2)-Cys(6) binuclear cluster domain-containing protein [Hirsutella rhossiliensis]
MANALVSPRGRLPQRRVRHSRILMLLQRLRVLIRRHHQLILLNLTQPRLHINSLTHPTPQIRRRLLRHHYTTTIASIPHRNSNLTRPLIPIPITTHPASAPQPPAPLQPSPYAAESQPRHMSYDGGPPSSYEPHHSGYPSATETFYSVYSSVSAAKKKNTRASQACDQCRQLKAKCDETKPCKTCRDKGTECRYRDPVPKATDKAQADILEGITMMQNSLSSLVNHVGMMNDRITKLESSFTRFSGNGHVRSDPLSDDEMKAMSRHSSITDGGADNPYHLNDAARDQIRAERLPMHITAEDEIEAEPGPPVPPGEPAIPINHTTLAGLLLEWPPIREITKHHVEREGIYHVREFPISPEQNRGPLIVYGRGEDSHPSRHRDIVDHGQLDMADDSSDMASPSPAADWGRLGGLSPGDQVDYRGGVLGIDGNPDFSEFRVKQYVESFKENILNMHPIIQPKTLDDWVQQFLDSLPRAHPKSLKHHTTKPGFAFASGCHTPTDSTGLKRKRSPGPDGLDGPVRAGRPERSIHNALILTVLALGKICLHRDCVPDALHHGDPQPQGSPMNRNGIPPSPIQGSPPSHSSHSHSSSLASPREPERGAQSRRSSIHGPGGVRVGYSLKKNYEVIPGLEYFAFATDILGNHTGAYKNMKNVYADIFAGLYQGQLARPIESFAFIHQASHKLQVIMRPSLDKLRKMKHNREFIQDPKYNQLALAFWTCLQLESDLIAEMPLPPSGLLSYEDDMPHPNMSLLDDVDQRVLDSYPGQLYLRTHLNSIHRLFYAPEDPLDPDKQHENKLNSVELVAKAVLGMDWIAPRYAFNEDDPPADDILSARLRGKYWGAQVITYRPFVRMILEFNHSRKNHPSSPHMTEFREGYVYSRIASGARTMSDIDPKVVELAQRGIKALVESTRAFHGLGEKRPIITNVFGTAHAQWGNLLVLAAAYKDPILHAMIDEELLQALFVRTISFLRQSATATSSLRIDKHILEGLQRDLFAHDPRTSSSFSSGASLHTPKMLMAAPPLV